MAKREKNTEATKTPDREGNIEVDPAPTNDKAVKAAAAPAVRQAHAQEPPPAVVPLRVYLTVCGVKPDQVAGFRSYATRKKLAPRPMREWRAAYDSFMNGPVC